MNSLCSQVNGFKKQDDKGYPLQENTKLNTFKLYECTIYTLHNTILMNTHCTSLSTTYIFLFYYIMIYVFTLKHLNIPVSSSHILHPLIWMSLIIPFSPIIIINFTIILYPLFVRRALSPFTLFVNQCLYWGSLKRRVGTCNNIK